MSTLRRCSWPPFPREPAVIADSPDAVEPAVVLFTDLPSDSAPLHDGITVDEKMESTGLLVHFLHFFLNLWTVWYL